MARYEFRLPDIGEGTAEAECIAWHVAAGDQVAEDDPLLEVMTDKATIEITAPVSGRIVERIGNVGDALAVGGIILVFELADAPADACVADPPATTDPAIPAGPRPVRVLTTPLVRHRAAQLGIDLTLVKGSGPQGRIRQSDLDQFLAYSSPPVHASRPVPDKEPEGEEVEAIPIVGMRRVIAQRLQDTKRRIPHFSYIEEVEVTQLEALRNRLNGDAGERPKLTLLPFLIRAICQVLPEFPQINARYDDAADMLHRHRAVHVGIATQTPAGLLVTVARNVQHLDLWQSAFEIGRLTDLARSGKAKAAQLSGSTITITSLGAMGGLATTPVINSPEVAIVGVNRIAERAIVREGRVEVAKMMNLSCSFDHRIVDGWDAARFVQAVRQRLEMPASLFVGP